MQHYSVQQIVKLLGISDEAVIGHIRRGTLAAVNVGGGTIRPRWRISQADLDAFLGARRTSPAVARAARRKAAAGATTEYF